MIGPDILYFVDGDGAVILIKSSFKKQGAMAMGFQIIPLNKEQFEPLFELDDEALKAHGAMRMIADEKPGFPCRVSLQDAEIGETVLLLNYQHLSVDTPYRSKHAIFVRQNGEQANLKPNEIPQPCLKSPVAVRAFDQSGMMLDADIAEGAGLAGLIEKLLGLPEAAYLHLHFARRGCFVAKVVGA